MGTNRIGVINGALRRLGKQPISSLEDNRLGSPVNEVYDDVVQRELKHNWRWAGKAAKLKVAGSSSLRDDWTLYEMPPDAINLRSVFVDGDYKTKREYQITNDGIHAEGGLTLACYYTIRKDESEWPANFTEVIQYAMAVEFAPLYNPDNVQSLMELYQLKRMEARANDYGQVGSKQFFNLDKYNRYQPNDRYE